MSFPKRTVALDFDGVLHAYNGYQNGLIQGPIPGALDAVNHFLDIGWTVVVFTTRDRCMVWEWLRTHGFPPLDVVNKKEPFWVIVDDRALTFHGEWTPEFKTRVALFEPYWIRNRRES